MSLLSAITGLLGFDRSKDRAARAAEEANRINRAQLEFSKERYREWQDNFGDIQTKLSDYYKALGPDRMIHRNLVNTQRAYQKSVDDIRQNLAKRGLGNSNLEHYMIGNAQVQKELQNANIRANAEEAVNQQKMQFLNIGLNQQQGLLSNVANASNTLASGYMNQAGMHNANANATNQFSRNIIGTGIGFGIGALADKITSNK